MKMTNLNTQNRRIYSCIENIKCSLNNLNIIIIIILTKLNYVFYVSKYISINICIIIQDVVLSSLEILKRFFLLK